VNKWRLPSSRSQESMTPEELYDGIRQQAERELRLFLALLISGAATVAALLAVWLI
jgi:hypothetical protein